MLTILDPHNVTAHGFDLNIIRLGDGTLAHVDAYPVPGLGMGDYQTWVTLAGPGYTRETDADNDADDDWFYIETLDGIAALPDDVRALLAPAVTAFTPAEWAETVEYWQSVHLDDDSADALTYDPSGPRIVCDCCGVTYRGPLQEGE